MGPIEISIIIALVLLLFGHRLVPKWGRALGETVGIIHEPAQDD